MTFLSLQTKRAASRNLFTLLTWTAVLGLGGNMLGVVPAQAGRYDEKDTATYKIKRIYKEGDKDRYRIKVTMSGDSPEGPVDMVQTAVFKETTKEASDDGAYKLVTEFESVSVKMNGMETDLSATLPKITETRDKDGKTDVKTDGGTEESAGELDGPMKLVNSFSSAFLPAKSVKIGDSWEVNPAALGPDAPPELNFSGKATLVSVETVKGVKIAKIKGVIETTEKDNSKVHSVNTVLVDLATGKTLELTSKTEGDAAGSMFSIEISQKMLGPGDAGGKDVFK